MGASADAVFAVEREQSRVREGTRWYNETLKCLEYYQDSKLRRERKFVLIIISWLFECTGYLLSESRGIMIFLTRSNE
jgi:hypothetical protein